MAQQVQFVYLTQQEYDTLSVKTPGQLYFTSDTKRVYRGSDVYTQQLINMYGNTWEVSGLSTGWSVSSAPAWDSSNSRWTMTITDGEQDSTKTDSTSASDAVALDFGNGITAELPIVGYRLGTQTAKPIQPQGDYALKSYVTSAIQDAIGVALSASY